MELQAAVLTKPLEILLLSSALDGSSGTNRATGNKPQIAANTDVDAIKAWLARFIDTKTTFDNYRKEAERLLLWSTITLQKPLSSLTHEDMLLYSYFLKDPQPASRWIMPRGRKVARAHPDWRPFAGPLSASSQRQAIVILNTLFSWLVTAGYLAGNPLSLSRQRNRKAKPRIRPRYAIRCGRWPEIRCREANYESTSFAQIFRSRQGSSRLHSTLQPYTATGLAYRRTRIRGALCV